MSFNIKKIKDKLQKSYKVTVGIPKNTPVPMHKDSNQAPDLTMAQLANMLHNGTKDIPARPFLKVAIEQSGNKWTFIANNLVENVLLKGADSYAELLALGEVVKSDIRTAMLTSNAYKPNAYLTSLRKGFHKPPLVDEGYLLNSFRILEVKN